jgi:hypothetical protein
MFLEVQGISCLGRKGLCYFYGVTMFPWGVKSLSFLGEQSCPRGARGLKLPMDMVVLRGNLNPLLFKSKKCYDGFFWMS